MDISAVANQNVFVKMENDQPVYYLLQNGEELLLTTQMIDTIIGDAFEKVKKQACIYKPEKVSISIANFSIFWDTDKFYCSKYEK